MFYIKTETLKYDIKHYNMRKYVFILGVFFILSCTHKPRIHTIYIVAEDSVADSLKDKLTFNSIEESFEQLVNLRKESNRDSVIIHFSSGTHYLSTPIKISADYGSLNIVGSGSEKTVLKGSRKLTVNWKKHNAHIWVTQITEGNFDQLFINGKQQILARYPNYNEKGGHWQGHAADAISAERVKNWENPTGAYVHAMHSGEWGGFHYQVMGKDANNELILNGGHQNNRPSTMHKTYRMVENVFEELDSPGEWFLNDSNQLYYWPTKEVNLKNARIEGVFQKHLIEIEGTENHPVKNIAISGIRFEHTQRTLMEKYEPLLRSDWTIYRGAAVFLERTEHVTISNCEFTNLGGNAILVSGYNQDVLISENNIHDCGASGVSFVGRPEAVRSPAFQYGEFVPLSEMDTIRGPRQIHILVIQLLIIT